MDTDADIDELLKRCRAGDDVAHAEFYNRYQPYIHNVVRKQLGTLNVYHTQSDIEDIANDIILKFSAESYQSLESIRSIQSIHGWLYVLVKNFVTSHVRQQARSDSLQQRFVREQGSAYAATPSHTFLHREQAEMVQDSLKTLDTQERLVVTLYYVDRLKYYEIAEMLSMNINTVATKLKRAKEKLHKSLRKHKDDL